jgi:hypothetical protein
VADASCGAIAQAGVSGQLPLAGLLVGFLTGVAFQNGVAVIGEMLGIEVHGNGRMHKPALVDAAQTRHIWRIEMARAEAVLLSAVCRFCVDVSGESERVIALIEKGLIHGLYTVSEGLMTWSEPA